MNAEQRFWSENVPISLPRSELAALLVYSVGYALGRKTYVPSDVCRLVREYHAALTPGDVRTLLRYIDAQAGWDYGDACDEREWLALKTFLEGL